MKNIFRHQGFWFAVTTSAGVASIGLLGGLGLNAVKEQLISLTPLIIALPAMNAAAGDYASIITAHLDDPETYPERVRRLVRALCLTVPVSILSITALSLFIADIQGYEVTSSSIYRYAAFIAASIMGIVAVTFAISLLGNHLLRKRQLNSDDILIPFTNGLASILMLTSFAIAARFYF
jgi:cation transporter-like permease